MSSLNPTSRPVILALGVPLKVTWEVSSQDSQSMSGPFSACAWIALKTSSTSATRRRQ